MINWIFTALMIGGAFFIGMAVSYRHFRNKIIFACARLTSEINSGKWSSNMDDENMLMQMVGAKECMELLLEQV